MTQSLHGRRALITLLVVTLLALSGCTVDVSIQSPQGDTGSDTLQRTNVTITHVVDADTMKIRYPDGDTDTIRLLGVDAPETHAENRPGEFEGIPDTRSGRDWLEDWGHVASVWADRCLDGERVQIAGDPLADRRGGYDRLLVYVYVDDASFNRGLLERGYARLYDSPFEHRDDYAATERSAQDADRGLWGFDSGSAPTTADDGTAACAL